MFPKDGEEKHAKDPSPREKLLRFVDGLFFNLTVTIVTIGSIVMMFMLLFDYNTFYTDTFESVNLIVFAFYVLESLLRIVAMTPKKYFTSAQCVFDFVILLADAAVVVLTVVGNTDASVGSFVRVARISRLTKLTRIERLQETLDDTYQGDAGGAIHMDEEGHIYHYNSSVLFSSGFLKNLSGTVLLVREDMLIQRHTHTQIHTHTHIHTDAADLARDHPLPHHQRIRGRRDLPCGVRVQLRHIR
jgi:hypothetical protein